MMAFDEKLLGIELYALIHVDIGTYLASVAHDNDVKLHLFAEKLYRHPNIFHSIYIDMM